MKIKYTALLITLITVGFAGSLQAQMTFVFSDTGSNTTLITASGSADLTGTTAASGNNQNWVGWDNFSSAPPANDSTSLWADSDFFSFNTNKLSGFNSFEATLGSIPLNINGVPVVDLAMDGPASTPFFSLFFDQFVGLLPQTGIVTAEGSAVFGINFADLPYAAGNSIDLQGNGDVVFEFAAIPEPTTVSLLGLSALAGVMLKRHRSRTNRKDVIPSKSMVEKW